MWFETFVLEGTLKCEQHTRNSSSLGWWVTPPLDGEEPKCGSIAESLVKP